MSIQNIGGALSFLEDSAVLWLGELEARNPQRCSVRLVILYYLPTVGTKGTYC